MVSINIGEISLLNPREVSAHAITVLQTRLATPPRAFIVCCRICGAPRQHPTLIDPGQIIYENFSCSKVGQHCGVSRLRKGVPDYVLVPGSLVFAFFDPGHGRFWPAIVEDSYKNFSYITTVHGGVNNVPMTAYYVTMIHERNWYGGWVRADCLHPFNPNLRSPSNSHAEQVQFDRAVSLGASSLYSSLRRRLLKHSFVAHVASSSALLRNTPSLSLRTPRLYGDSEEKMEWTSSDPSAVLFK